MRQNMAVGVTVERTQLVAAMENKAAYTLGIGGKEDEECMYNQ